MIWFLRTDARVPERMRREMARYGLCKDEWQDNEHWPWYLYVREARRMRGAYVMTQRDIIEERTKDDVIHLGSHWIDSHQATRCATGKQAFVNEGRLWQRGLIYQLPYRTITPRQQECENLLVPVCCSASHVAFCTIRLEPTWMHLGEAAGIAAAMAAKSDAAVQDVDVPQLQKKLRDAGIPLDMPKTLSELEASHGRVVEGSPAWVAAFFQQTDTDDSSTVSKTEWLKTKADWAWLFSFIDKNDNGEIERASTSRFKSTRNSIPIGETSRISFRRKIHD